MSYGAFCLGSGGFFSPLIGHQSSFQVMKERAEAVSPALGWVELNSTVVDAMDAVDASASMVDASAVSLSDGTGLELASPSSVLSEAGLTAEVFSTMKRHGFFLAITGLTHILFAAACAFLDN